MVKRKKKKNTGLRGKYTIASLRPGQEGPLILQALNSGPSLSTHHSGKWSTGPIGCDQPEAAPTTPTTTTRPCSG